MTSPREVRVHLLACFEAPYRVLGEGAPGLTNDACLVRAYELARAFGELALLVRDELGDLDVAPLTAIEATLSRALLVDPSGALALYVTATLVAPRLLVSLRDARLELADPGIDALVDTAQARIVAEVLAIGGLAERLEPADAQWLVVSRELGDALDAAGFAESFGLSG